MKIFIFLLFFIPNYGFSATINHIGEKGDSSEVDRVIVIKMYDNYFEPNEINIKKGETIKFLIKNFGSLVHEFNIATNKMHLSHQAEMLKMMEKEILNYKLNCDIKSKPYKDNIIEVSTILKLTPNQDVKHKMLTEINLTALVSIDKNFQDKKELEKIILVKIPAEVYPTLYETFIYLFKQAGIKDINIEKNLNFEAMYNEKKKG